MTEDRARDQTAEPARTGWRLTTKLGVGISALGVILVVVGLSTGEQGVAVVGFLLLFVVASWLGLAW